MKFTILYKKKSSRKDNVLTWENIVRLKVYIFGWLIDSVEYVSAVGDLKGFDSVIGPIYDQHSLLCQINVEVILIHLQIKPNQNCIVIIRLLLTNWINVPFFLIKKNIHQWMLTSPFDFPLTIQRDSCHFLCVLVKYESLKRIEILLIFIAYMKLGLWTYQLRTSEEDTTEIVDFRRNCVHMQNMHFRLWVFFRIN